jgi:hypothetical protein
MAQQPSKSQAAEVRHFSGVSCHAVKGRMLPEFVMLRSGKVKEERVSLKF